MFVKEKREYLRLLKIYFIFNMKSAKLINYLRNMYWSCQGKLSCKIFSNVSGPENWKLWKIKHWGAAFFKNKK